jgi:anti-anti-sigma regulatory factor
MMSLFVETEPDGSAVPGAQFEVHTVRCDALRANVAVSGDLGAGGAAVLAHVIDGHVRSGRRFLRLDIGGVRTLGAAALEVLVAAHDQLLARRGTLILTGVSRPMEARLRTATPASPLLLLAPTAAEAPR